MPRLRASLLLWVTLLCSSVAGVFFAACGGSNGTSSGGGADGGDATSSSGSVGDGGNPFGSDGGCATLGNACKTGSACCSGDCVSGACGFPGCTSDNGACTKGSECCSGTCTGGKCAALNSTCKTLGNACTGSADCCSGLCSAGTCQPSSFCGQPGDSCQTGANCCTGVCNVASGQTFGTCNASPPAGATNCTMVDGVLCAGSGADGGTVYLDGGIPSCGGGCCSRSCAPWGPTGVLVCQPATGCHTIGDLCTKDTDCCGAMGVPSPPAPNGKFVQCQITPPAIVGICSLAGRSCEPNGAVCKLKTMSCNATCDCCAGNCETMDTCKQDNDGVPRCANAQCGDAGSGCASSADCCNGAPCVPNPSGNPPYVCSGGSCVSCGGACTNNSDCCPGGACSVPTGGTSGTCSCGSNSSSSGGSSGSGSSSGGGYDAGCALYGQVCTSSAQCCNGVPCTMGRCIEQIQ
jgi:hypothetical protein